MQATSRFSESGFGRTAFGDAVFEHYAHFYRVEAEDYQRAVTDWERVRYFDRI
jgi:glutamine synthetase